MTDDQHPEGTHPGVTHGSWERLPQADYDDGATAFVQLPEGGIDALLAASDTPLAAPGHGYVPPSFTPAPESDQDTGTWGLPTEGAQWPDPNTAGGGQHDGFAYHPGSTGQWAFQDSNYQDTGSGYAEARPEHPGHDTGAHQAGAAPGHDVTGQWSIPVADGDLPDESGEFSTSALVKQWGGTPPATLPGGAPAAWAAQATGQPWDTESSAVPELHEAAGAAGAVGASSVAGEHGTEAPVEAPGGLFGSPYGDGGASGAPEASQALQEPPGDATADGAADVPDGLDVPDAHDDGHSGAVAAREAAEAVRPAESGPGAGDFDEPADLDPHAPDLAADETAEHSGAAHDDGTETEEAAGHTQAEPSEPAPLLDEHPLVSYVLRVNGTDRPVTDAWIGESLLYVLRERLGLAGAKDGCSQGECGACNVQVDGRLVASCLVPAVTAAGSEVRTVEGLATEGRPSDVQRALARCGAVQCGFCVPGMAMTVHDLLEGNPAPTELETRQALCGNLCRCSGYRGVLRAVQEVVTEREAHASAAESESDTDEARIPHQAGPGAGGVNPSAFEPAPHEQPYGQDGGQV
ncbi:Carbon-monoxide dehydrogenase (acceptor) [Actinobacteria bacterium OK074]|nr:Carbon-monoxide dehydrogenase (acceptor) [Actinobacteria bacterium OK074]